MSVALHQVEFVRSDLSAKERKALGPELVWSHKHWLEIAAGTKPEPGHGALLGHQWQAFELASVLKDAGFTDAMDITVMLCVGLSESQGYDKAIHVNTNLTEDWGWLQLDSAHGEVTEEKAYDIEWSARFAKRLVDGRRNAGQVGFEDWVGFTSTVYLHDSYMGRAVRGVGNMVGGRLLKRPVQDHADGTPYEHHFKQPVLDFWHRNASQLYHVEQASKALGRVAASKAKVDATQIELGKARIASKAALPQT